MTVVITGARGYIGSSLVARLLAQEAACAPLGRAPEPGLYRNLRTGAVGPLALHLRGARAVVHLAGQLVHDPSAPVSAYFEANVALADDVAAAAVAEGVGLIVHASSRLVYPATLTEAALEDRDARPDTPYGLSKRWAEDAIRCRTAGTSTAAISLRIAQVTGGDHPGLGVINRFVRQARTEGRVTVLGRGVAVREIVHVDDVADAFLAALSYSGEWLPVNIGGTEAATVAQLADAVAELAGGVPVVHGEAEREDLSVFALDHQRALQVLGWEARRTWRDIIAEVWAHSEEAA